MSGPSAAARRLVLERAVGCCEYCRMHQLGQGAVFHIDHVTPSEAGGSDEADNLALACPSCNLGKLQRMAAVDPDTGRLAALFNPRRQVWADHFAWVGLRLAGRTPTGRATVDVLDLNSPRRLRVRVIEQLAGLFPPEAG